MELDISPPKETISDDTPIWRYMDLPKFVSMLVTGGLYFAKASTLRDDPYEGFCKAVHREIPDDEHGPGCVVLENVQGQTAISVERMIAEISRFSADSCVNARDHLYVNSWCLACESMAMWQIYGSHGSGIAVKSSIGQYKLAARFDVPASQYTFGEVQYHDDLESSPEIQRDFSTGSIPLSSSLWSEVLQLGFHKRSCYGYEKEWRSALYQDPRPDTGGVHIAFDLNQLISDVYVGPRAEEFFVETVSSLLDKFLLRKPLKRSTLLSFPRREAAVSTG